MKDDSQPTGSHLIAGEEEARRRISREIHDDYCQRLAALALELKVVRRKLPDDDPRRSDLDGVGGGLAELSEDLRRLSHDLHPAVLERLGLEQALRDHCAEVERRSGLQVRLSLRDDDGGPLPPAFDLGFYRIVQEALSNIVRHAGARTVQVTLKVGESAARLTVSDDGTGFDPAEVRRASGLGLASIEERAQLLGGECRIASAPGAGSGIEVTVPLPAPELHRLRRLVRRHRQEIVAAALVILALAGGLVASAIQARRAQQEAMRADAVAGFLEDLFKASDPRQARGHLPDARELLQRGTGRLATELKDQPSLRARLLDTLGGIHTDLGLFDEARPLLTEALGIRERRGDPQEVAATLVRLGVLARLSGKGDSVALFQRALALREARHGNDSPDVADVLGKLGTALAAQGKFDEAETTLRRSLTLSERLWGNRDPRVAKILHNLGGIAYYRHRPEDAGRLLQRALTIREAILAPDDPDLGGSLEALALLRQDQGRLAEAEKLLERQASIAEKVYGPGHPELARTLLNLGLVREDLGEDAAARQLFERALAIQERAVAPVHPELVRTLASLADLHFKHQRYAEAEPLFLRLMKLRDGGATYDRWADSLAHWASLLRATGREAEAARVSQAAAGESRSGG